MRDKVLSIWLFTQASFSLLKQPDLDSSLMVVGNNKYKDFMDEMHSALGKGEPVLDFRMEDNHGKTVQLSDFKGKVVFIDMWYTGCGACMQVAHNLSMTEHLFQNNPDVVFISISIDNDRQIWLHSIQKNDSTKGYPFAGKYAMYENTVCLYTSGKGVENPFIQKYVPSNAYPNLLLVDRKGNMFSSTPPRPEAGPHGSQQLAELINEALKEE